MTAALGFDTWLAMRHGAPSSLQPADCGVSGSSATGDASSSEYLLEKSIAGSDLGCYYCNDVVAPRDVSIYHECNNICTGSSG